MKGMILLIATLCLCLTRANSQPSFRRFDSTFKIGKVGYRAECRNKNDQNNDLNIRPIGFEAAARSLNFLINGRVMGGEIDDLNNDGFPDLVLYIRNGADTVFGTVYGFASQENKSIIPFALPDVQLNGKVSQGYKGHDQFYLMEGYLMQKFPLYKPGDEKDRPTGGNRTIQYRMSSEEGGRFKFELVRFYDSH